MEGAPSFPRGLLAAVVVLAFLVSSAQAAIVRPLPATPSGTLVPPFAAAGFDDDLPPDGLLDFLLVNVTIDVTVGGEFLLIAQASPAFTEGHWLILDPGRHDATIPIDGRRIRSSGMDGPYAVDLFLEVNCHTGCQLIDQDAFTTPAFQATDFEGTGTAFLGPAQDAAVDLDDPPDGLFDVFRVDVPIRVTDPAEYWLWTDSPIVGRMRTTVRLPPGDWIVRLEAPGWRLRQSGVQGPFSLTIYLATIWFGNSISMNHFTQAYDASTFASTPASPASGASDVGVDLDNPPDGHYDAIEFRLPADVNASGEYRAVAYLSTLTGTTLDSRETVQYLPEGRQELVLRFAANGIAQGRYDGPYRVGYSLLDRRFDTLGSGQHTSGSYPWTAFDPPLLEWDGPISDAYVDLDSPPDDFLDEYVARLPIRVNEAGTYGFFGFVNVPGAQIAASNHSSLSRGPTVVNLTWPLGAFTSREVVPSGDAWVAAYASAYEPIAFLSFVPTPPPDGNGTNASSLAGPLVRIVGSPQTSLPDADGDGLYDALEYVVRVHVSRAGPYVFTAMLLSAYNNLRVSFATNQTVLPAGDGTVRLVFPGWAIRASGLSGPYEVYLRYRPGNVAPLPYEMQVASELFYSGTPALVAYAFDPDRPSVRSRLAQTPPVPDGFLSAGEWTGATAVDLSSPSTSGLRASALVMNDADHLYVALDVLTDGTADDEDAAALAFDVLLPDDPDDGWEMQVGAGFTFRTPEREWRLQADQRYDFEGWSLREAPFDAATPARANLTAAMGFGTTDAQPVPHRVYEFRIPLSMLGASEGETIGFGVYSLYSRGIRDGSGQTLGWPVTSLDNEEVPLNNLARLVLASTTNRAPSVTISTPSPGAFGSGVLQVLGAAADPDGDVQRVDVRIDGGPWQPAVGTTGWSFEFDSRLFPDGPHTIAARAFDGDAYSAEAQGAVSFDNTAPVLEILAPVHGAVLPASALEIRWNVSDAGAGVGSLTFQVDGQTVRVLESAEAMNGSGVSISVSEGVHRLTATVRDRVGNERTVNETFRVDTNPLSLTGPYGPIPFLGLTTVAVAATLAILYMMMRRRRRKGSAP